MEIVRANGETLKGPLAVSVEALLDEAYGPPPSDPSLIEMPEPTFSLLMLYERQEVIGHLAAFERDVMIGAEEHSIGMIGDIAVASKHRRQGLCKKLVQAAHEHFRNQNIPYSILFAFKPEIYRSSGYHLMNNEILFLDDEDGRWKNCVYRGSMYCELGDRPWPNEKVNLRGPTV